MFHRILLLCIVCVYLADNASALLTTCPTTSTNTSSIRLNMTVTICGIGSYPGAIYLASNGNFILLASVSDVGPPQNIAIQGNWSCSSSVLVLTGSTFYFLQMSVSTVTSFACSYKCDSTTTAFRSCSAGFVILPTNQAGIASMTLGLVPA